MNGNRPDTDRETLWFLITALVVGGAEQTLVDLANNLDTERYDVVVWTIFDANPLESELDPEVQVRALSDRGQIENGYVTGATSPLVYVTVPARFCYHAAVERPAIIQSFLFFDNMLARLAGLVCPATIITGVRAVPNDRSTLRTAVDRLTTRLSDVVVSNSEAGARYAEDLGAAPDDVTIIRNGRHVEQFRTADPGDVNAELGIDDDELVVGTVGRLIERKGHFELVTAWAEVERRVPEARLLVVGDGADRDAIEAHAEELGCADTIDFLGRRSDVPELLATMDVFAFPSHFEGLPGAVIEAMAAGRAIVATPVDGTAELLDGYRTGLFVPVDDPDTLAWGIVRLLEHPQLRAELGESAQADALAEFTIARMVEQFEALYRDPEHPGRADAESPVEIVEQ